MTATRVRVPLLDLRAQYATLRDEVRRAVDDVFESQVFIGGPHVTALEDEVARYVGADQGIGVTSGTDALLLGMWALGIGPGDEVITSPYTFFATVGSIARLGAKCKFVDIDPATFNLDVAQVEKAITKKTRLIVPVHLYGQCVDMAALNAVAGARGIPVMEDAAQAIGSRDAGGGKAGSLGRLACFSFFPSKNLGGAGDGGLITTKDADLAHRMRVMRNHGMEPKYHHKLLGGNFRLDAVQAAVLRVKLRHLDGWHEARRHNAAEYRRLFVESEVGSTLVLPVERAGVYHIYNQFVVRVPAEKRDGLVKYLQANGIGCEIYYPIPAHLQECFAAEDHRVGDYPESEKAAAQTLALPIYPELTAEQRAAVVEAVAEFLLQ